MTTDRPATLLIAGDTNLQHRERPADAFQHVLPLLGAADVRFANLEGPLAGPSDDPAAPDIPHKLGWRHSDPRMVEGLLAAGIDAVGCANNVTYPPAALLRSLAVLDAHGIAHAGGGRNLPEARRPVVIEREGVRYGLLSYTSVFWPFGHAASETTAGVATIKAHTAYRPHARAHEMPGGPPSVVTWPDEAQLDAMCDDVRRLRAEVDVVTLSCHWGVSSSTEVCDYQRAIGRAAIEAGADIVAGHGPHTVQGIEVFEGPNGRRPVFYSLGNFVFDWTKMLGRHLDGLLVRCTIENRLLASVAVIPVQRREASNDVEALDPVTGPGRAIVEIARARSAGYGTVLREAGDAVVIEGIGTAQPASKSPALVHAG